MIQMKTGKPVTPGIYVVQTTVEAVPDMKMFVILRWTGTIYVMNFREAREWTRSVYSWAGPIVEPIADEDDEFAGLEYDL